MTVTLGTSHGELFEASFALIVLDTIVDTGSWRYLHSSEVFSKCVEHTDISDVLMSDVRCFIGV